MDDTQTNGLSERELEILRLIATGASNKDIARRLFISTNTVKVHLRNIFGKIRVASRTEAAMYAVRIGLVQSPTSKASGEVGLARPDLENSLHNSEANAQLAYPHAEVTPQPVRGLRGVSIVVLIVVLVTLIGVGIVLVRQPIMLAGVTNLPSPTPIPRWQKLKSLPSARYGLAAVAYENQIYAIGGETSHSVTGEVESYDLANDTWLKRSSKPLPVTDVGAVVIGGKVYVPGGRTASGAVTNVLDIYDPRQDTWIQGAHLPVAISGYAIAAFEGRLYLFGGWDGQHYFRSVYIYNLGNDEWTEGAPMPTPRTFAGAATAAGKIYVMGGKNEKGLLSVNEVYTPSLDGSGSSPWQNGTSLPEPRAAMGVTVVADLIYIMGGEVGGGSPSLEYIQGDGKSWQNFETPVELGKFLSLITSGTQLYALGGIDRGKPQSTNMTYKAIFTILLPVIK